MLFSGASRTVCCAANRVCSLRLNYKIHSAGFRTRFPFTSTAWRPQSSRALVKSAFCGSLEVESASGVKGNVDVVAEQPASQTITAELQGAFAKCGEVQAKRFATIGTVPIPPVESKDSASPPLNAQTNTESEVAAKQPPVKVFVVVES